MSYTKIQITDYETILDSLYNSVFVSDCQGIVLYVNQITEVIFGVEKKMLLGRSLKELENEGIFSTSVSLKTLESRQEKTILTRTQYGKTLLAKAKPIFNEDNTVKRIISVTSDVSRIFDLKKNLEEKERLLEHYSLEIFRFKRAENFIFEGSSFTKILDAIDRIAPTDLSILLLGESGVGKTSLARMIHKKSLRQKENFQIINCGVIPESLLESELFGYEKGAFTGARQEGKIGLFEQAQKGTVFLDEIGELHWLMQVKLLEVIQEKRIRRVGGSQDIYLDFRLVAATNKNLEVLVAQRDFREDLYYRLNGFSCHLPALRERSEDIRHLSLHFLRQLNEKYEQHKKLNHDVLPYLEQYSWPGNLRELHHCLEAALLISSSEEIMISDLPEKMQTDKKLVTHRRMGLMSKLKRGLSLKEIVESTEAEVIREAYESYKTSHRVAKVLGISQATAYRKILKYVGKQEIL